MKRGTESKQHQSDLWVAVVIALVLASISTISGTLALFGAIDADERLDQQAEDLQILSDRLEAAERQVESSRRRAAHLDSPAYVINGEELVCSPMISTSFTPREGEIQSNDAAVCARHNFFGDLEITFKLIIDQASVTEVYDLAPGVKATIFAVTDSGVTVYLSDGTGRPYSIHYDYLIDEWSGDIWFNQ